MQLATLPTPVSASLHQALRNATAEQHEHIETNTMLTRLLAADLTLTEYATILIGFKRFFHEFEAALAHAGGVHRQLSGYQYQTRLPPLEQDIDHLQTLIPDWREPAFTNAEEAKLRNSLPCLTHPWQQIAAFYVIEGASQGGRIISKRLLHKFKNTDKITAYFQLWQTTPDTWQRWQHCAAKQELNHLQIANATETARNTFLSIEHALPSQELI